MRRRMMAALAGVALMSVAMPAQAAWKSYVNKQLGIAFMAPGEIKASIGNSRGAIARPRQSIIYRSVEDGIAFRVHVLSFFHAQAEGANLLGEREYMFQDRKTMVSDTFARVGTGAEAVYGRKLVVDLPDNKGRSTGAFFFHRGKLFVL